MSLDPTHTPLGFWCAAAFLAALLPARRGASEPAASKEPTEQPAATEPPSTPRHCYGDGHAKWVFGDSLVMLTNPAGAENQARFGRCWPLVTEPGVLFDYTHVEAGLFHNLSPVYLQQGGYLSLAPLSLLVLRAEASWVHVWSIPVAAGMGHFGRSGYDDSFPSDGIDSEGLEEVAVGTAGGVNLTASATLQASIPLSTLSHGDLEVLLVDATGMEYWRLGDAPFYYNQRKDVILARTDWLVTNVALLLLAIPFSDEGSVRFGAIDSLVYLPDPATLGINQLGGLLALNFERAGESLRGLQPFLLVTGYTHHTTRDLRFPMNFLLGVDLHMIVGPVAAQGE